MRARTMENEDLVAATFEIGTHEWTDETVSTDEENAHTELVIGNLVIG